MYTNLLPVLEYLFVLTFILFFCQCIINPGVLCGLYTKAS